MNESARFNTPLSLAERLELDDFYTAYAAALDEGRYRDWPSFFVEDALYRVVPRENHELGLPLATMHCEGRGMMLDRVSAIEDAMMVRARSLRRFVSGVRVLGVEGNSLRSQANVLMIETLHESMTRIAIAGYYVDRIVREQGRLLLAERLCIYDSLILPDSLVAPV